MSENKEKTLPIQRLLFEQMKVNNAYLRKISQDLHIIRNKIFDKEIDKKSVEEKLSKSWADDFKESLDIREKDLQWIIDQIGE